MRSTKRSHDTHRAHTPMYAETRAQQQRNCRNFPEIRSLGSARLRSRPTNNEPNRIKPEKKLHRTATGKYFQRSIVGWLRSIALF